MLLLSTGLRPSIMNLRSDVCLVGMSGDQSHWLDHIGPGRPVTGGPVLDPNHSNHKAFNIYLCNIYYIIYLWSQETIQGYLGGSKIKWILFFAGPEPSSQAKGLD